MVPREIESNWRGANPTGTNMATSLIAFIVYFQSNDFLLLTVVVVERFDYVVLIVFNQL
jgi:hypothetical protein